MRGRYEVRVTTRFRGEFFLALKYLPLSGSVMSDSKVCEADCVNGAMGKSARYYYRLPQSREARENFDLDYTGRGGVRHRNYW